MAKAKEYTIVVGTNLACSLIVFLFNVMMRRVISPYEMGLYTSVNLIITYLNYAQAGVLNAYNRDYPQLLGAGDKQANRYKNTVFNYLLVIYGIITIFFIVVGFLVKTTDKLLGYGLAFCGIVAGGNALFTFCDFTLKSNKKFYRSACIYFVKTTVQVFIGLICILRIGYQGIYIGLLVSLVIMALLNIPTIKDIKLVLDFHLLKTLISSGFLLLANNIVWTIMQSIDRFVILKFMDMEQLGVYSVALMGFSTMILVPQSLSQIFYVKISRTYGRSKMEKELIKQAIKFTSLVGSITSLTVVIAYYALPIFVENVMPMYIDCIQSTQYIILGVAIYGTTLLFGNVLSVLKKNLHLIVTTVVLCIINLILSSGLVMFYRKDIESVAMATSISYVIYAVMLLRIALGKHGELFVNACVKTLLPVGIIGVTLLLADTIQINSSLKMSVIVVILISDIILQNYTWVREYIGKLRSRP